MKFWQDKQNANGHVATDAPNQILGVNAAGDFVATSIQYPIDVYQATYGKDTNPGNGWHAPFLTSAAALAAIQAAGGGSYHVGDGSTVNLWLRGDGVSIPGWFGDFPLRVFGYGNSHWSFGFPGAKLRGGTQADMQHPQIWLAGTFQPKEFHNIAPYDFINQFVREWDYRRNQDGSIQTLNVTTWVRSGQIATVTLALPAPKAIDSIARPNGSGVVTLTYTLPRRNMGRIRAGQVIRVASSDVNFDSGDFVVTSVPLAGTTIQLTYTQTTTAGGPYTSTGATVQSADLLPHDRIEVTSANAVNVPSTEYLITAISNTGTPHADVITVRDPYGGTQIGDPGGNFPLGTVPASGTFASPGAWVLQDRYNYNFSSVDWYNVQGFSRGAPPYDSGLAGPFIDVGGCNDGRQRFFRCAPGTYTPVHGCQDPDRVTACLMDPGGNGSSAGDWYNCRPAGFGIRRYGSPDSTDSMRIFDMLADAQFGVLTVPPVVEVIHGGTISLVIDGVFGADRPAADTTPDVLIDSCAPGSRVDNSTTVIGPVCIGGNSGSLTQSAWAKGQTGTWTSGNKASFAGDMPHVRRALPLAMARFANLATAPASWINVTTLTTGVADNWGGTSAVRVQASIDAYVLQAVSMSIAAGEWVVYGGWVRKAAGFSSSVLNVRLYFVAGGFADYSIVPYKGDGEWQPVEERIQATAAVSAVDFSIPPGATSGAGVELSGVFFERPASVSTNEAAEYAGTIGNRTITLTPGTAGTLEGVPFVASGGIGVASTVPVAPSGTASPTKNVPLLSDDGTTVQGYIPLLPTNSNLPAGTGTVTAVGASAPVTTTGGTAPVIGVTDFVASGASHARGTVPDPGATPGTTKFLREDATFAVPPGTGVTSVGATAPVTSSGGTTPTIALTFDGTSLVNVAGTLERAALTGDATASAGANAVTVLRQLFYYGTYTPASASGWLITSNAAAVTTGTEYIVGVASSGWSIAVDVIANTLSGGGIGLFSEFFVTQNGANIGGCGVITNGTTGPFVNSGSLSGLITDSWGVNCTGNGSPTGAITVSIVVTVFP